MTDRADLEASLAEMDRKLRELQRELALVSPAAGEPAAAQPAEQAPPPPPPPPPPAPAAPSPGAEAIEQAAARVAELGRRIDELGELRDELDRATRALQEEHRHAAAAPAPPAAPSPGGDVVVNAGPFADISTLGAFEHALRRADGVSDALVRSFEGNRAIVDVSLERPIDLASQLVAVLPFAFEVDAVGRGELTLTLRQPGV